MQVGHHAPRERTGVGGSGIKCELYHDSFQNWKSYPIQKAQLIIADIPYNLGDAAYGSNPMWYVDGDNRNGESDKAKSSFFTSDGYFRISEYFMFCSRLMKPEPAKNTGGCGAPCMIVFCAWQQQADVIRWAADAGFGKYIPLVFIKNYSPQVLKANMKIVGATEYAIVLYRERLPKFNNGGSMIFNWMPWEKDGKDIPKIHPTQKPVKLLKRLIDIFTDPGDVVIDPVAGSGSTLRAAAEMRRNAYGFEIDRNFYREAKEKMLNESVFQQVNLMDIERKMKYEQIGMI